MQLSIVGCPDKERFRPYVKRAAIFYAQELMSTKMSDNIFIRIKFNSKLDALGYAGVIDYNESNKPREFEIELNPIIGSHDILETLAHEMVHAKQYIRGQYRAEWARNGKVKKLWLGKTYSVAYLKRPWELEAFRREGELALALIEAVVQKKQKKKKYQLTMNPT